MCCRGCQAVAEAIIEGGLADYYRYRTASAPTGHEIVPEFLRKTSVYDHPQVQRSFVRREASAMREASLILEGITCAACVWLSERYLSKLDGIESVQINYSTRRARVRWNDDHIHLSEILQAISRIGYLAHPYDPGRSQQLLEMERRQHLRRLGVAGVLGMQIMTLAVALYFGDWTGIETGFRRFFHWVSLLLALPIILYSAQPFFRNAWRDVCALQPGMDVPVTLGIAVAFVASAWTTVTGRGAVYYDSVAMFVFFLLTARYFELGARRRAAQASEALVLAAPAVATRLVDREGIVHQELVLAADLRSGDRVLIRAGESVPSDGVIIEGASTVDESLLTGESLPVARGIGQPVIGGAVNVESPLTVRIEQVGQDTVLSAITRLLDRAQSEKPRLALLAHRTAAWFVSGVLLLAGAVAYYWLKQGSPDWLMITMAVLVVTCPCALSLATPAAITAATGTLTRLGLLATRGHALEALARATHFIFDKTGTLTRGQPRLLDVHAFSDLRDDECLRLAASLERHSEHPLAGALIDAYEGPLPAAANVLATPGAGLQGEIAGQVYFLGTPAFVESETGTAIDPKTLKRLRADGTTVIVLAGKGLLASFTFVDEIRPQARPLIATLKHMGKQVMLLTGDHGSAAQRVARAVGVDRVASDLTPADKLQEVRGLQRRGAVVAMVGDGVNDAPALSAAQVSIAVYRDPHALQAPGGSARPRSGGAHLAAASADMILMSQDLTHLAEGVRIARKTVRVVRQNLTWAVVYNLVAVPAAALGYVTPWVAALGMSLSSLLVVVNALRLIEKDKRTRAPSAALAGSIGARDRVHEQFGSGAKMRI